MSLGKRLSSQLSLVECKNVARITKTKNLGMAQTAEPNRRLMDFASYIKWRIRSYATGLHGCIGNAYFAL